MKIFILYISDFEESRKQQQKLFDMGFKWRRGQTNFKIVSHCFVFIRGRFMEVKHNWTDVCDEVRYNGAVLLPQEFEELSFELLSYDA